MPLLRPEIDQRVIYIFFIGQWYRLDNQISGWQDLLICFWCRRCRGFCCTLTRSLQNNHEQTCTTGVKLAALQWDKYGCSVVFGDKFITKYHRAPPTGSGVWWSITNHNTIETRISTEKIYSPVDELAQVGNWEKAEFSAPEEDNSLRNFGSKKIRFPIHLLSEVEENRELPATGQLGARLAQFVKECVGTCLTLIQILIANVNIWCITKGQ